MSHTPGTQDEGHRELASGQYRALKDLVSLVMEFEGVQHERTLWAHELKVVTAGETPIQEKDGDGVATC